MWLVLLRRLCLTVSGVLCWNLGTCMRVDTYEVTFKRIMQDVLAELNPDMTQHVRCMPLQPQTLHTHSLVE
jgi:hypothetical protein